MQRSFWNTQEESKGMFDSNNFGSRSGLGFLSPRVTASQSAKEFPQFTPKRGNQRYATDHQVTLSGQNFSPEFATPTNLGDASELPSVIDRPREGVTPLRLPSAPTQNENGISFSNRKVGRSNDNNDSGLSFNLGSTSDQGDRVVYADKVAENLESGAKVGLSHSTLDDQQAGPSYQQYVPANIQAKATESLVGKRGGVARNVELSVGKGRFLLKSQIGAGSFGEIFWGIDTASNKEVAIKLESIKVRHPQLLYENRIYKILHNKESNFHPSITRYNRNVFITTNKVVPTRGGAFVDALRSGGSANPDGGGDGTSSTLSRQNLYPTTFQELREVVGFPISYYYGTEGEYNVMVMDLLGPNLEDLFNYCHRRLSIKTVCLLADQMLHRIEYLHHKGFIHRDLKPENFVMGGDEQRAHILHLIDYGLSKRYRDPRTNLHVTYKEGKSLTGTARYCSINAHLGIEQSRRDDIEGLGYILLYFLKRGFLPWQGVRGAPDPQTKNVRISEKKINTRLEVLCRDEPPQILKFLTYARGLKFEETPDYISCREFFASIIDRNGWERDWVYDWVLQRQGERIRLANQASPSRDLELQRSPTSGALGGMENSLNLSKLEAKNSSNHIQFGADENDSPVVSLMLSGVDVWGDVSAQVTDTHNSNPAMRESTTPRLPYGLRYSENNRRGVKAPQQQVDLPGELEYML